MGATQSISQPYTLSTPKGDIRGIQQTSSKTNEPVLNRYTRIPYAHPPTGSLRWRRPQPVSPATPFTHSPDVQLDHTTFAPAAPQPAYNTGAAMVDNPNAVPPEDFGQDEDCLYLNIWTPPPSQKPPGTGWPVQFHIHGGWLQIGNASQEPEDDPYDLYANPNLEKRIIVAPTYRLNILGFAAGQALADANAAHGEKAGNFGLWDQRSALEWVYNNIALFGGDPEQITVGGLSAGSHSAFLQLYHDTYAADQGGNGGRRIIKQVYLWSNALIIQPNPITGEGLTNQFDELCKAVGVDKSLAPADKVEKMRHIPSQSLIDAIPKLNMHTFRSSTDAAIAEGGFVPPTYLASLHDGSLATKLSENEIRMMIGEVKDEALLYKLVNPPNSRDGLIRQIGNYYPRPVVDALLRLPLYGVPAEGGDAKVSDDEWATLFAKIVADCQVHASLRGLVKCLLEPESKPGVKPVKKENLFRYKIEWRAKGLDNWIKPKVGVCHAADSPIWWALGWRADFDDEDKRKAETFLRPFEKFIAGAQDIGWPTIKSIDRYRVLNIDGIVEDQVEDDNWKRGLQVWDAVWTSQKSSV